MLPIEALKSRRSIFTHRACADGSAAAMIAKAALPHCEVRAFAYDDPEYRNLPVTPGALWLDIAPWAPPTSRKPTPDELLARRVAMLPWVDAGAMVCDHHASARDLVAAFGDLGVFGENTSSESGAWLAFREVFVRRGNYSDDFHRVAHLSAVYDTWRVDSPDWRPACHLAALLQTVPLSWCLGAPAYVVLQRADDLGTHLHADMADRAAKVAKGAVRDRIGGRNVAIVPTTEVNLLSIPEADIIAGFRYQPGSPRVKWSLRSSKVDVGAIAERNGGGGHKAAAGFHLADDGRSPYAQIADLLEP